MGVEEYSISEAHKHEGLENKKLDKAYQTLENSESFKITLPYLRNDRVDFEIVDEDDFDTIKLISDICDDQELRVDIPDQPEQGNTLAFLIPDE